MNVRHSQEFKGPTSLSGTDGRTSKGSKLLFAPDEIEDLIRTHPRAWAVWLAGYETGLTRGAEAAAQTQEQQADRSARRFYAMTADEEDTRRLAQIARDAIETAQARHKTDVKIAAIQNAWQKGKDAA